MAYLFNSAGRQLRPGLSVTSSRALSSVTGCAALGYGKMMSDRLTFAARHEAEGRSKWPLFVKVPYKLPSYLC